ncbi:MAG: hypothetical protein C0P75_008675 [Bacilli bacterium]|jgi:hypothetical protein|uniref:hypothetical protein n=1 Tax=Ureibacillus sp. FSL W7-1570 TaxID=2954593 RepID=UPI001EB18F5A|nr:hypothetical protein [Bacilli bacterium]
MDARKNDFLIAHNSNSNSEPRDSNANNKGCGDHKAENCFGTNKKLLFVLSYKQEHKQRNFSTVSLNIS